MNKEGSVVQSGTPKDLYNNPNNSYVAEFFGETNKFKGTVKNSTVMTPIGNIPVTNMNESEEVDHSREGKDQYWFETLFGSNGTTNGSTPRLVEDYRRGVSASGRNQSENVGDPQGSED